MPAAEVLIDLKGMVTLCVYFKPSALLYNQFLNWIPFAPHLHMCTTLSMCICTTLSSSTLGVPEQVLGWFPLGLIVEYDFHAQCMSIGSSLAPYPGTCRPCERHSI